MSTKIAVDERDDTPSTDMEAALRRCEEQLVRKTQALKALDQLTCEVASELNSLFVVIGGFCGILAEDVADNDQASQDVADITEANRRAIALVQGLQLARFPRRGELPRAEIEEVLEAMRAVLHGADEEHR